jgi:hypothetical protein
METQPPDVVSVPSIDVPHYFKIITQFFTSHGWDFWTTAKALVGVIVGVSIPISIFFLIAIVMTVESIKRVRALEDERYNQPEKKSEAVPSVSKQDEEQARRWRKVVEHSNSTNPNDWKQAIIEADIMLDQLLTKLGYRGDSVGDKLKRTTKGDFKSQQAAWDAHLVRNRIAHDGSDFDLNEIEAKRVIGLYRQVFEEFYHISEK